HISELSEERVEKPEDVVQLGQEMEFKILRIDSESKKIGLSARAVGKEDEPIVDTKVYSSQAGSGMASLGELADFGLGRIEQKTAEPEPKPVTEPEPESEDKPVEEPNSEDRAPVEEPPSEEESELPGPGGPGGR
ncbi:MAG TPA: S1 RNA-binding domain-containing protein, partial [Pyrinomonadaceae bacterium]|nr:S1 RNA-binding domain-containing protein [Pyrinomonadaceae bacterium]